MELLPKNLSSNNRRLKITHLNNDCLESVFSYLNLTDLTNVAESNVYLAKSARSLFTHQNQNKEFKFNCYNNRSISDNIFLLVLQHFGKCLVQLRVQFRCDDPERSCTIFDAIVENCRATLKALTLLGVDEHIKLKKPFLVLEKLQLRNCLFGIHSSMIRFNRWFPNVSTIQIYNITKFWESGLITKHFPKLKSFGFITFPFNEHTKVSVSQLARFLHLNPQLKCLELDELHKFGDTNLRATFNKLAPIQLPNIERLEVVSPYPFPCGQIKFDNLKELKLSIYRDKLDIFNQLPRTIECFELTILDSLSASAHNYILNCLQLKKLKIEATSLGENVEEIAKKLHALTHVHVKLLGYGKPINSQTLDGLEYFFVHSKQIEAITLEYKLNGYVLNLIDYNSQVELVHKFTKTIETKMQTKWSLSHLMHCNENDLRSSEIDVSPYIQHSFKKKTLHS